jgi:hypothetical protein
MATVVCCTKKVVEKIRLKEVLYTANIVNVIGASNTRIVLPIEKVWNKEAYSCP